jgi:hypothetical protein
VTMTSEEIEALERAAFGWARDTTYRVDERDAFRIRLQPDHDTFPNATFLTTHFDDSAKFVADLLNSAPRLLAMARRAVELEANVDNLLTWNETARARVAELEANEARDAERLAEIIKWFDDVKAQGYRLPVCAHCQEPRSVTDGTMAAHVRACPKNPMVQRIAALEEMLDYAADYIRAAEAALPSPAPVSEPTGEAEQIAAWLERCPTSVPYPNLCRTLAAEVRAGRWRKP